jgi:hypothetical protein
MTEVTILKDQRQNVVIEVATFYETDDELTSLKAENVIYKQRTEHSEKMYSLLKGNLCILFYKIKFYQIVYIFKIKWKKWNLDVKVLSKI